MSDGQKTEIFAPGAAILLLQAAASQAEIGPFARRALETPREAARHYRAAMAANALRLHRSAI
ncbi:hypothetical protein [Bosea sp. PAMC 26642]|uniref:hypothetical protein n=1 Tax=Bosea sp. (strain PAMC 26642) TaxID=1792307 RepID=UPI0007706720|nr:hypothetical protein [Bosea sp. PAMC 26642]AMJ61658.1 hypothetical protein AXW83_16300 [Bosea sp. PAMC 26642]